MSVHIAVIGYHKEPIKIGLKEYGGVSKLFLLHSPDDDRFPFETTARELAKTLTDAGTDVELREIEAFRMNSVVETIVGIFTEDSNQRYYINITGGTKNTAAEAMFAAFIIGAEAYYVLDPEQIESSTNPILQLSLPQIGPLNAIKGLQLDILKYLHEMGGECNYSSIREGLNVSGKRLSYHIKKLGEKRLITSHISKTDSRARIVKITNSGRLVAKCRVSY
jgi:CRISPR locus-related DNA-binding protein